MGKFHRNLGVKSMLMLTQAGIETNEQFFALGAVVTFLAVKRAGCSPSLNLLWAIEGALTNRDWKEVARNDRLRLLMELEDAEKYFMRKDIKL
jgi:DNA transformation protein